MGKYFNGKRFNYIKTGDTKLSGYAIRKLSKSNNKSTRAVTAIGGLGKRVKKSIKNILESHMVNRHRDSTVLPVRSNRQRKANHMGNISPVKTKKKEAPLWRRSVSGVGRIFTRSFIALRNLAKKLYEFLDDV